LTAIKTGTNTNATFAYDENGLRTRKVVGNEAYDYYYNGSVLIGMLYSTYENSTWTPQRQLKFSYDASGNVVSLGWDWGTSTSYGTPYYYLRNGQGYIVGIMDGSGQTHVTYTYDTWGNPISTVLNNTDPLLAELNPFRYRGYVYDTETNLYYCQSRYYDPSIGRFISPDSLLSTGQGVLGYNMYAYCLNNPINMKDETGNDAGAIWWATMWWLSLVDGLLPIGDAIYVVGGLVCTLFLDGVVGMGGIQNVSMIFDGTADTINNAINSQQLSSGAAPPDPNQLKDKAQQSIDKLMSNKTLTNQTRKVDNYEAPIKGWTAAYQDFYSLDLINVTSQPNGTLVGELSNGTFVNLHTSTSGGVATIEFFDTVKNVLTKIRY
jgi:RHS repeat-associated protein